MIRIGLAGVGRMGSYHLDMYEKLTRDRGDIELVAICDVEAERLSGKSRAMFNMGTDRTDRNMDYHCYSSVDAMLAAEKLDMVDVVVPTYLHAELAVKVLEAGCNCMCEKPMALNEAQCEAMLAASRKSGKLLMIGQCLHFWREYAFLHDAVADGRFGKLQGANFWRGGFADHEKNPSWHDWIITAGQGGGGLFDQHIHDTDFILWTLGKPKSVTTFARKYFPKSVDDIVMSNYQYDNMVISAQDDIAYRGLPFGYGFVADFEKAAVAFRGELRVYPEKGESYVPELTAYGATDDAYYNELDYFLNCIRDHKTPVRCSPEGAAQSVAFVLEEARSARENRGE